MYCAMYRNKRKSPISYQECHIAFDTHQIIRKTTELFLQINPKLKKTHVDAFVKDVFYSPQFECEWNEYHNIHHTFEVVEMVAFIVSNTTLKKELTSFERTILLVAALCHDFGHNGKTNNDWDDEAIQLQQDRISSICSNMSSESLSSYEKTKSSKGSSNRKIENGNADYDDDYDEHMVTCLTDCMTHSKSYNEVMHLDLSVWVVFKHKKTMLKNQSNAKISKVLSALILATDLRRHNEYIRNCKDNPDVSSLDKMIIVLKLADLSHVLRSFQVHAYWVYNLIQETNKSTHAHRSVHDVPTIEYMANDTVCFAEKFVGELLEVITRMYPEFPIQLLTNYTTNLSIWKSYLSN